MNGLLQAMKKPSRRSLYSSSFVSNAIMLSTTALNKWTNHTFDWMRSWLSYLSYKSGKGYLCDSFICRHATKDQHCACGLGSFPNISLILGNNQGMVLKAHIFLAKSFWSFFDQSAYMASVSGTHRGKSQRFNFHKVPKWLDNKLLRVTAPQALT